MRKQKLLSTFFVGILAGSLALSPIAPAYAATDSSITIEEIPTQENTEPSVPEESIKPSVPEESIEPSVPEESIEPSVPEESIVPSATEAPSAAEAESPKEQQMFYTDSRMAEAAGSLDEYLNEDPSKPQKAIMLNARAGASLDGYQLNHNQVKVLNINTGNITIYGDTYTQENGETDAPWDAKSDAYVIRGKGSSTNTITINSPLTKLTIYIMDLEWSGSITYSGDTELDLIICGKVVNNNVFLYGSGNNKNNLAVKGISADGNSISANNYILYGGIYQNILFENMNITSNYLSYSESINESLKIVNSELDFTTYNTALKCNDLVIDHSKVTNIGIYRTLQGDISYPNVKIQNNSKVTNFKLIEQHNTKFNNVIQITDSIVDNIESTSTSSAYIRSIYKLTASNSDLYIGNCPITNLEADKCSIELVPNIAFQNIIANNCSIKNPFTGTPVDFDANDLYLKTIRLRDLPNEYVYVSVNGSEKVKLLTDLNGCLYPYVKGGTTSISVTTEDGTAFSTTFDPISENDANVTILTPGGGTEGGDDAETAKKPLINDSTLNDLYLNMGDPFTLTISATSQTSPSNLAYQWYKNGVAIDLIKAQKRTYTIAITKPEHIGVYSCYVTDKNNNLVTKSKEISITAIVPVDPTAPVILGQSSDMNLTAGSDITLTVSARPSDSRSSLTFQWYKDSMALDGKNTRTLTLTKLRSSDAGIYYCKIKDQINGKTVTSSNNIIKVK